MAVLNKLSGLGLLALALGGPAAAAGETPACAGATVEAQANERFNLAAFMIIATELEKQGEQDFVLKHEAPTALCTAESLTLAQGRLLVQRQAWQKAPSSLLYRFSLAGEEKREVLVLYHALCSLFGKGGFCFHVSEQRGSQVAWYAMYDAPPSQAQLRELVLGVLEGRRKPLLAVRWPKGAKEGELVSLDERLN